MHFFEIFAFLVLGLYVGFLAYGAIGFIKANYFKLSSDPVSTKTCIVVCARNEEKTIERCIRSILEQDFDRSLIELIVVNDASEDTTPQIANSILAGSGINHQILENPVQLGKKRSITRAVELCNSDLIIARDADTFTTGKNWLKTVVSFYENTGKEFIIAPLEIENTGGLLTQLQSFENLALAILTAGYAAVKRPFLCNGANLAFSKKIFNEVNGHSSHEHIASGDDVLFMEEVKKINSTTISYLKQKDAIVTTYPLRDLKSLVFQKLRWSQKSFFNPNPINLTMGVIVILTHILSIWFVSLGIFHAHFSAAGIIFISGRFFIDFLLLFLASGYFNKPVNWLWFIPLSLLYSLYVLVIVLLSIFIKPNWK